jgi:hypothetical protein
MTLRTGEDVIANLVIKSKGNPSSWRGFACCSPELKASIPFVYVWKLFTFRRPHIRFNGARYLPEMLTALFVCPSAYMATLALIFHKSVDAIKHVMAD